MQNITGIVRYKRKKDKKMENVEMTTATETVETAPVQTEGKKKPGRPATYDVDLFISTFTEVYASGGEVQDVADILGMTKIKVGQVAAQLRNKGHALPGFRRGRKKGQKNKVVEVATDPASVQTSSGLTLG